MTFQDKQKTLFKRKLELKKKATHAELVFKEKLDFLGIKYIFQKGFIQGDYYCIVDFYLPKPYKLCIEIDGGYHMKEEIKKKDAAKDKYLKQRKLQVLRLSNEIAESIHPDDLRQILDL